MDWETFNTPKIKTLFYVELDYRFFGTRIRFKCDKPIQRTATTLEGELCTNWDLIDSFGVGLYFNRHTDRYGKFYDDPSGPWWMPYNSEELYRYRWLIKYATVDNRSPDGKKGFILNNGTFERFEPIGITWNDSYCRRIKDAGPSGCFVERNLSTILDFNYQENNCTGKDSTKARIGNL